MGSSDVTVVCRVRGERLTAVFTLKQRKARNKVLIFSNFELHSVFLNLLTSAFLYAYKILKHKRTDIQAGGITSLDNITQRKSK